MTDYGDFQEIQENPQQEKTAAQPFTEAQQMPTRIRMPRDRQIVGVVVERLGGKFMSVKSADNKTRHCRVPGRFKRKFWLRQGDAVLIEPWEFNNEKADIVHQYQKSELNQLKKRGLLNNFDDKF